MSPQRAESLEPYAAFLGDERFGPLSDWLVLEILGVILGAALSAGLAGQLRLGIERGPRFSENSRIFSAFTAGTLMAFGAKLARGCTSGQALTRVEVSIHRGVEPPPRPGYSACT